MADYIGLMDVDQSRADSLGFSLCYYQGHRNEAKTALIFDWSGKESTGLSPEVQSVSVTDSTHIRVTFVNAAVDNAALRNPDNYVISPSLTVYAVTTGGGTNPTYVNLTIDEQLQGQSYTVTLQRIVKA